MAKVIDWAWIERQWRTGQLSNVQLARLHEDTWGVSVSEGGIRKRAKEEGWQRNLAGDVRREVQERLVRDGYEDRTSDREVVEEAAERAVQVVRGHRSDIREARETLTKLRRLAGEKLTAMQERQDLAKTINEENNELLPPDAIDTEELQRVAAAVANMTTALTKAVGLERQAFSIDPKGSPGPGAGGAGLDDETAEQLVLAAAQTIERKRD